MMLCILTLQEEKETQQKAVMLKKEYVMPTFGTALGTMVFIWKLINEKLRVYID